MFNFVKYKNLFSIAYNFIFMYNLCVLDDNVNGGGNMLTNGNGISAERPLIGMYVFLSADNYLILINYIFRINVY